MHTPAAGAVPADAGPRPRRAVLAWCLYDWACSPFAVVIITFVFASYFQRAVAANSNEGTAEWGFALSLAGIAIAILSPILGAIADRTGRRRPWLIGLTLVCIAATGLLWFVRPSPDYVWLALLCVSLANIGYETAVVFYNALLASLAPPALIGRLSGWAWALGYAGGLTCLMLSLFLFVQAEPPLLGLDTATSEHIRIVGPLVAAWFLVFATPLFLSARDPATTPVPAGIAVREGLAALASTLRNVRRYRNIMHFLVARLLYVDGLNTLFAFGGIYAAGTFKMEVAEIIKFGILLNVTAGLGAFGSVWVDERLGSKRTVLISLAAMVAIGIPLLLTHDKAWFWALGGALGIFMGPAQSASRALMARLAPPALQAEMFGLYALAGKVTAFIGPALVGWATLTFDTQRAGMASVLVLMAIGGLLLTGVREERAVEV